MLLAVAVFAGVALAHRVGLAAPVLSAIAAARPVSEALRPQLVPGLLSGVVGAALLWLFAQYSPEGFAQLQVKLHMPPLARRLYGGIT